MSIDVARRTMVVSFFKVVAPLARQTAGLREQWLRDFSGLMDQVATGSSSSTANFAASMADRYTEPLNQLREKSSEITTRMTELARAHRAFHLWLGELSAATRIIGEIGSSVERPDTRLRLCREHLSAAGERAAEFARQQKEIYVRYGLGVRAR